MEENRPLLVVEDREDVILVFKLVLRKVGFTRPVHFVRTGEEALSFLCDRGDGRRVPRLVLLDIHLPGLSGFDVLEVLRMGWQYGETAVVMCSASSDPADINRAYQLGANAYLVKPDSMSDWTKLAQSIQEFWDSPSAGPYWLPDRAVMADSRRINHQMAAH